MLEYLYIAYDMINFIEMVKNDNCLKSPSNLPLPIKTLFKHIKNMVNLTVAVKAPYTPQQVVAYSKWSFSK